MEQISPSSPESDSLQSDMTTREVNSSPVSSSTAAARPFCDICKKTFKTAYVRRRHMRSIHGADPNLICTIRGCNRTFKRKDTFERHRNNQHGHSKVTCANCARLIRRDALREHQRTAVCKKNTALPSKSTALVAKTPPEVHHPKAANESQILKPSSVRNLATLFPILPDLPQDLSRTSMSCSLTDVGETSSIYGIETAQVSELSQPLERYMKAFLGHDSTSGPNIVPDSPKALLRVVGDSDPILYQEERQWDDWHPNLDARNNATSFHEYSPPATVYYSPPVMVTPLERVRTSPIQHLMPQRQPGHDARESWKNSEKLALSWNDYDSFPYEQREPNYKFRMADFWNFTRTPKHRVRTEPRDSSIFAIGGRSRRASTASSELWRGELAALSMASSENERDEGGRAATIRLSFGRAVRKFRHACNDAWTWMHCHFTRTDRK